MMYRPALKIRPHLAGGHAAHCGKKDRRDASALTVAILDKNFDRIRTCRLPRRRPEHFDKDLADAKVWLLKPVGPRLQWPRSPDLSGVANDRFV
jgi:hypothetical protein